MDEYENTPGVLNVAETCAASVSVDDLVALCEAVENKFQVAMDEKQNRMEMD